MATKDPDRSPADPKPAEPAPERFGDRSLTKRWWWPAAVIAITGAAIIGMQWDVIQTGEAIVANWIMVAIGGAAIAVGGVVGWRSRPNPEGPDEG
jgi:hypothetical protein